MRHLLSRIVILLYLLCGWGGWHAAGQDIRWEPIPPPTAQSNPPWFVHSFQEDADLHITDITQIEFDDDGVAWLATTRGFVSFDGYHWVLYPVSGGTLHALTQDPQAKFILGTNNGIGYFDGTTITVSDKHKPGANLFVQDIKKDHFGRIWLSTDEWPIASQAIGLYCYSDNTWTLYTSKDGLPSNSVLQFYEDSQQRQFVLTRGGLARVQTSKTGITFIPETLPVSKAAVWSIFETREHEIWINTDAGIFVLKDEQWRQIYDYQSASNAPLPNYPLCLGADHQVYTILNTQNSLVAIFQWKDGEFVQISAPFMSPTRNIANIQASPDGSLWCFGHNSLIRWAPEDNDWLIYNDIPPVQFIDKYNRVWFSGDRTLVKDGRQWFELQGFHGSVIMDQNRSVWMWNSDRLVHCGNDTFTHYDKSILGLQKIESIKTNSDGHLFIQGISVFRAETKIMAFDGQQWTNQTPEILRQNKIIDGYSDPHYGMWYLCRDTDTETVSLQYVNNQILRSIPGPQVYFPEDAHLYIDLDGDAWVYSQTGVFLYTRTNNPENAWKQIPLFSHAQLFSIHHWNTKIWLGLYDAEKQAGILAIYDKARNVWEQIDCDIRQTGKLHDQKTLYYGGNGRIFFFPEMHSQHAFSLTIPASADVTHIVPENDKLWLYAGKQTLYYTPRPIEPETIITTPVEQITAGDSVQFSIQGVHKNIPKQKASPFHFAWRLNNKPWSSFQAIPSTGLLLTSLSPGRYTLQACVRDINMRIDPTPAEYIFFVHPVSLHQKWWFKALMFLIALTMAILAMYSFFMHKKLALYASNLEGVVGHRTEELRQANQKLQADIHKRKQIEIAMRESEKRYRLLLEEMTNVVWRTDTLGILTYVSPASLRLLGYPPHELIGQSYEFVMSGQSMLAVKEFVKNPPDLKQQDDEYVKELQIHHKNGNPITAEVRATPIFNKNRQLIEISGLLLDITEKKKLEDQLRQSQKMEAIGKLAGGVAHDFNNLLTGILGYSNILLNKSDKADPSYKHLIEIKKAGDRAASLTSQLLSFSRKKLLEPQTLDLNDLIINMDKMLRRLIGEDIELVTVPDSNRGFIRADYSQIEQIVLNLVINARDAMPTGGKITITTRHQHLDANQLAEHIDLQAGDYVILDVRDTGSGMTDEVKSQIFEPFFTTKDVGQGTGLGLSTVYGIVKQSRGVITVSTTINQGTTFTIYFPKAEQTEKTAEAVQQVDISLQGTETILLVEDEELVRNLVADVLQEHGYTVLQSRYHGDAIPLCKRYSEKIDLLLIDVILPQVSGTELAKTLTSIQKEMKVVYMSGYTDDSLGKHGGLEDGIHFLQKPFSPREILRKVRNVLTKTQ